MKKKAETLSVGVEIGNDSECIIKGCMYVSKFNDGIFRMYSYKN